MKNKFKSPLFIASCAVFAVCLIAIIVLCCIPHGKTYVYKGEEDGVKIEQTLTFSGDKVNLKQKIGERDIYPDGFEIDYEIKDGKLYSCEGILKTEVAEKINAFKIDFGEFTAKCTLNIVLLVIAIVGAVAGAVGVVLSVFVLKPKKENK